MGCSFFAKLDVVPRLVRAKNGTNPDIFTRFGHIADIGRYNIIDIISYHYITFSRILIFLYHILTGDIFVI
jgi:hypothetical protein